MDSEQIDELKQTLGRLSPDEQDQLAGFLLVERLKRNSLVMPSLHKRVEDSDPDNWQTWGKSKESQCDD